MQVGIMPTVEVLVEPCNAKEAFNWCRQQMPDNWGRLWKIRGHFPDFCKTEDQVRVAIWTCNRLSYPVRFYFRAFNTKEKIAVSKLAMLFKLRFQAELAAFLSA